ncbi:MAG: N-ethylmaleimide reductase [uncultured Quadrisphaera sp.]|uniref:N-ethylmaleimide reductase n=1 Tax=uncultured Quadrisphaera sp. TaxID=904978 RepID=A0A6J4NNQ6_9ACTN|nr:MAG: N-ethylmaleimide reductase [uncultured Quadrisphaera sp.]
MTTTLWEPTTVGALELPHRVAMAPMTRSRATPEGVPTPLMGEYYAQRASTALIITEGTQPSEDGQGYILTPGAHTPEHVAGWRQVTDAVHAAGGRIFIQLMHVGRISHPDNTPHHRQPVAPSAVAPAGDMFTAAGMQPMPVPRAMSTEEVTATVADFAAAARSAVEAGADGVEIHGANGYLLHQFLSTNANTRTDGYGGSVENRIRFAVEVATAVAEAVGPERTGIRISPGNPFNDVSEADTAELYPALVAQLAPLGLAYLHVAHGGDDDLLRTLRAAWPSTLLVNRGGAEIDARADDLASGLADVITVGTLALANPDLVQRLRTGAALNTPDQATFYGGDSGGYTDYPTLEEATAGPADVEAPATPADSAQSTDQDDQAQREQTRPGGGPALD